MAVLARIKFALATLSFHSLFMIIFAVYSTYDMSANAMFPPNSFDPDKNGTNPDNNPLHKGYPMFQDVHVMIFIGFGFLMTFLRKYGYSSVGLNMLIASFVIEWSLLLSGLMNLQTHPMTGQTYFTIGLGNMLTADFAAAAVLITFGALLGKTSPLQMIVVAFLEIIFFTLNEYAGNHYLHVRDVGGSMFVHAFGAYFGLAVARVVYTNDVADNNNEGSNYHADLFSMIGTIFLWLYWPSFNAAVAVGDDQHRAVVNTYLALCACCVTTFAFSAILNKDGKFDMAHVQNATLAGGVAVGTTADMMIHPIGAMVIGTLAGILSTVGFVYITPLMSRKLKIHDTCGVHNLHGMPAVLAGLCGAVAAGMASEEMYGLSLYQIFPARTPLAEANSTLPMIQMRLQVPPGMGRTGGAQAGYQLLALLMTIGVAIVTGALTGLLLKLPIFDQPRGERRPVMSDELWWETPDDFRSGAHAMQVPSAAGDDDVMEKHRDTKMQPV